ncbi:hypothetical protein [Roseateles sp. P5_E7]
MSKEDSAAGRATATQATQLKGAVLAMATFAAEEFERISALSQTLQVLMRSPRFYSSPALAEAQLTSIAELAEAACASVDQIAEGVGIARDRTESEARNEALVEFRRSLAS